MSPRPPRSGFKSTLLALSVLACTAWANLHGHVMRHHQPQAASVKPRTTPTSFDYAAWTEWAGSPARPTDAPKLHVHRHAMHARRGEGECGCENCCEEDGEDDKDKDKDKDKAKQKTETVTVTADINENTVEPKKKGANLRDAIKSCGGREFAYVRIRLHCSMKKDEERNLDIHHCGEADEWQDLWIQWHSEKVARGISAGALTKCQTFIIQPRRGKGKKNRAVMRVFDKESNLVWNSDWESGRFIPFLSESDNPQDNEAENYIFKCEEYNVKDSSDRLLIGKKCHIINKQEDGRLRCLEAMEYNEGDTGENANVKGNLTVNRCSSENEMQLWSLESVTGEFEADAALLDATIKTPIDSMPAPPEKVPALTCKKDDD